LAVDRSSKTTKTCEMRVSADRTAPRGRHRVRWQTSGRRTRQRSRRFARPMHRGRATRATPRALAAEDLRPTLLILYVYL
jgi:hypothetical protein